MRFSESLFNNVWTTLLNLGFKANETDVQDVVSNVRKEITGNPDKFMKILIKCGVTYEQLQDWEWFITELEPHKYHCTGYHPVCARIDIIKENILV